VVGVVNGTLGKALLVNRLDSSPELYENFILAAINHIGHCEEL
jgi:hypothetical protein